MEKTTNFQKLESHAAYSFFFNSVRNLMTHQFEFYYDEQGWLFVYLEGTVTLVALYDLEDLEYLDTYARTLECDNDYRVAWMKFRGLDAAE